MKRDTIAVIALISAAFLFVAFMTFAILQQRRISTSGVLTYGALEIYWDYNCTSVVDYIDWGICTPNSTTEVTVFLRNEGTEDLNISIYTNNWNPVTSYITFTAENFTLLEDTIVPQTWSLHISPEITLIKQFSFDIIVAG